MQQFVLRTIQSI